MATKDWANALLLAVGVDPNKVQSVVLETFASSPHYSTLKLEMLVDEKTIKFAQELMKTFEYDGQQYVADSSSSRD